MRNSYLAQSPVFIIAAKEIKDSLRSRWLGFISLILLALSLSITFAGSAIMGTLAVPEPALLFASLSTISVFIIPLTAILLSYDAFVGEDEAGTLLLLLSYPLSKSQIILGKFIGHGSVMLLAILIANGVTASILMCVDEAYQQIATLQMFGQFVLHSLLLALTFILMGYIVSLKSSEKAKAVASLLLVWFVFVLLYDLLLLAVLVADFSWLSQRLVNVFIAMNPTDLFRAVNALALDGSASKSGLSFLAEVSWGLALLYAVMLSWILVLMGLSNRIFNHKPL